MTLSSAGQHSTTSDNEQAADPEQLWTAAVPAEGSPDNRLSDVQRNFAANLWRLPLYAWHAHRRRSERRGHEWLSVRKKAGLHSTASEVVLFC